MKKSNHFSCKFIGILLFVCGAFLVVSAQTKDYTRYVNPFIGTGGHGHTFPGATVPFGMVQLSPDTRIDNWDGSSGYHYSDTDLMGFSHTHLNGTGIPDYCDILLMPTVGDVNFENYKSTFSHQNEKAEPGYYAVKIDNGVFAELTATTRVGLHRYTFPKSDKANIVLDLKWRDKVLGSEIKIVGKNRVEGFRRSSSWAKDQVVYFVAEFSKDFTANRKDNLHTALNFNTKEGEKILVKVGISAVSVENARQNLQTEIPDWNFEKVRNDAKTAWNKELSKIEVTDTNEENLKIFYTALYHTAMQPNVFSDVNGDYLGLDKKVHNINEGRNPRVSKGEKTSEQYTIFSLWDTFRAAHPLYTIVDEKRTVDFINTFIRQYEQGGRLPVWELAANETDTMIGYHSVSVIADAMAKGIKGFDYEKAFQAAKHSAELDHFGLEAYKRRGYISMEDEQESVSKTLEYAYNDYCIAVMAKVLNKQSDYEKYIRRARYFENHFDPETGFMRPKKNGGFVEPFAPQEVTFHFTEGNSWVYTFFVPQDVSRLMTLMGGREKFVAKLDELLTTDVKLSGREQPDITGLIGQYAHGNEPSHHILYLYNYAREPWKTQMYVHKVLNEFYKNAPDGLIGNEDCGQMSAWYILSASGFYQVNPSQSVYALGSPLFKEVKYNLENGKTFIIKTPNAGKENAYVKSVKLNGKPYRKAFITHDDIKNGGVLEFEMTNAPVRDWFTEFPVSEIKENLVAVPLIEAKNRVFENQTEVVLRSTTPNSKILYSINENPSMQEYTKPLAITQTSEIKAVTVNSNGEKSVPAEAKIYKKPNDWTVQIASKYNRQYTGGGDAGLIDGIRGSTTFSDGAWQGYQSQDFIATVDLRRETEIKRVGAGFLSAQRSWIFMPTKVEFEVSNDNANFKKVAEIPVNFPEQEMTHTIKDYVQNITPVKARYVRVKAVNFGKLPAWHPGAGFDAFIFVDEIIIG